MADIKYMEIVTWNKAMILMHGDKLTRTQKAIGLRSNGLHTAIRFTGRYGKISWHCTLADGMGGCGFKNIEYSHPYRQSRVYVPVTAEQEARLFAEALKMAGYADGFMDMMGFGTRKLLKTVVNYVSYGPNNIKYDKRYAMFGFITKWEWLRWKPHKDDMICNEAVANLLLTEWPNLISTIKETEESGAIYPAKDPAKLTPETFEYLARHYFRRLTP